MVIGISVRGTSIVRKDPVLNLEVNHLEGPYRDSRFYNLMFS